MIELHIDDEIRFWKKVLRYPSQPDKCWLWIGGVGRDGYGRFAIKSRFIRSHRLIYYLYYHIDPKEFLVCHTCDNILCNNPHHLFLGTAQDNIDDCINKGRKDYLLGEKHQNSKLTNQQILDLKIDWKNNIKNHKMREQLAEKYNISISHFNRIIRGEMR